MAPEKPILEEFDNPSRLIRIFISVICLLSMKTTYLDSITACEPWAQWANIELDKFVCAGVRVQWLGHRVDWLAWFSGHHARVSGVSSFTTDVWFFWKTILNQNQVMYIKSELLLIQNKPVSLSGKPFELGVHQAHLVIQAFPHWAHFGKRTFMNLF